MSRELKWMEKIITAAIIITAMSSVSAFQLTGNTYDSEQTVMTGGGTENTSSTNFFNQIALGQAATGLITSNYFDTYLGFFFASRGAEAPVWTQAIPTANIDEDSGWSEHDNNLSASGNGQCVDPNFGDTVTFSIQAENTAQVDCDINSSVRLMLNPAANWTGTGSCTVRCSDGIYVADYSFSIEVANVNDPPVIESARIDPTTPKTNDNITGYCNATDIDDDQMQYNYIWFIDEVENSRGNAGGGGGFGAGEEENVSTILGSSTSKGEQWIISCQGNDTSSNTTEWLNSSAITILNSPPEQGEPTITPATPTTSQDLSCINRSTTDNDSDTVYNVIDWRIGGAEVSIAVLNMPFDNNVSSENAGAIKDYSSYENNGTLPGSGASPTWNSSGQIGGAYEFDGSNDYINISDNIVNIKEDFTIEMWVKPNDNSQNQRWLSIVNGTSGSTQNVQVGVTANKKVYFKLDAATSIISDLNIDYGEWYHIAWVFKNSNKYIYINGTQISTTSGGVTEPANFSAIGAGLSKTSGTADGLIDEVKVYNRSLSPAQIALSYREGLTGKHPRNLSSNETNSGEYWTCQITPNDMEDDGVIDSNSTTIINTAPTISLTYPTNSSSLTEYTNRTPTFQWNGEDNNSLDTLNYTIWIYEDAALTILNKTNYTDAEEYLIEYELELDTPYWWIVEVYDGSSRVNSSVYNFSIESYKAISLTTDSIDFGSVERNTTVYTPANATPFRLENVGNLVVNVTIYANTSLWLNTTLNKSNYMYRVSAVSGENNAYNTTTSQTTWFNITNVSTNLFKEFNYLDSGDAGDIQINLTAPLMEPPGVRESQVVVEAD